MKKLIFITLFTFIVNLLPCTHIFAATEYYDSKKGLYYTVNNFTATITRCDSTDENVIIPKTYREKNVADIKSGAFKGLTNLKKVSIKSVSIRIGNEAFSGCTSLEEIHFNMDNGYIASLGEKAFYDCKSLTSIDLSKVSTIPTEAFSSCTSLKTAKIGKTVSINDRAFYDCNMLNLEGVTAKYVGNYAFYDCRNLSDISFDNTITEIGDYAFYATALKSLTFNSNVKIGDYAFAFSDIENISLGENGCFTSIGSNAFRNCRFSSIPLPEGLTTVKSEAFARSDIKNIAIPKSVKTIEACTFSECKQLETVEFLGTTDEIPNEAFAGCVTLKTVNIPLGVKEIGNNAFFDCGSLENVIIPPTVTRIGDYAFRQNNSLKSIIIPQKVNFMGQDAFLRCNSLSTIYYGGSNQKWESLKTSNSNSDDLENVNVIYTYKPKFEVSVSDDKNTVSVSTSLFKETGIDGGTFILALYSGNQLIDIQTKKYDGSNISFNVSSSFENAKVMFWTECEDMTPILDFKAV